jgi:polysaccharide biosynthesis protein PelG
MGGIGVEFRRLQQNPSYLTVARVFGYSLAMSVGPWLATIFTVGFVSLIGIRLNKYPDMTFFTATVTYIFAGSLIATGPFFVIFSRYLADVSFKGQAQQSRALIFLETIAVSCGLVFGFAAALYFTPASLGNSLVYQLSIAVHLASLLGLWCVLAYLDAQKRFAVAFYVFMAGCVLSVVAAYLLRGYGLDGLMAGYAFGSVASFAVLLAIAIRRSPVPGNEAPFRPSDLLMYLKNFMVLGWIGLLYNLGTWVDKFYLWVAVGETVPGSRFRIFQPYDISTFLSYLIMMPAIAYFLVMVETEFYGHYRTYLDHLENSPLKVVNEKCEELWKNLKRRMNNLFELEVVIAVIGLFLGTFTLRRLGLNESTVEIFQVLIAAAFMQVLFWITLILLLYFEFRIRALIVTVLFVVSNFAFTVINDVWFRDAGYGWGYVAAAGLSALVSWVALRQGLRDLNRHIFFINSAVPTQQ